MFSPKGSGEFLADVIVNAVTKGYLDDVKSYIATKPQAITSVDKLGNCLLR